MIQTERKGLVAPLESEQRTTFWGTIRKKKPDFQ